MINNLDKLDGQILEILEGNARAQNSELAKELNMVPSGIWERVKKLEESGIIKGYSTVINPYHLGFKFFAYVNIKVDSANWSSDFSRQIESIENVEELHEVLGEDSYLAKVRAKDMDDLSEILKNQIGAIEQVKSTKTTIVTKTLKGNSPLINENLINELEN